MSFAGVYPHYVKKVETKGRTREELDEVIRWLTGYTYRSIQTKKRPPKMAAFSTDLVGRAGIEPATRGLRVRCSTN